MRTAPLFAVVALLAIPSVAALSAKYKEWGSSPQSYFMTKDERAQWALVNSDDQAEQFVKAFLAARGPGFAEDVAKRAAVADKYLTYGKTPGSQTLRGKLIILLGPPSSFKVSEEPIKGSASSTASSAMNAGGDGGPKMSDMGEAISRSDMSGKMMRNYAFTYAADKLPASFGKPLSVTVELNTSRNSERIPNAKEAADVETVLETAAAASLKR